GMMNGGCVLALSGKAADAVQMITSGLTARRSAGSTIYLPFALSHLAIAHAEQGQFDDARRCIGEALTFTESAKEKWHEAAPNRIAGEIAQKPPEQKRAKAKMSSEPPPDTPRQQQAKPGDPRAAMSPARLWRDQGKVQQARELL